MTPSPQHDKPPNKRALTYGVGATSVALGTIITAGGTSGVDDSTIRLAIVVFGVLTTLSLLGGLLTAWSGSDKRRDSKEKQQPDRQDDEDGRA